MVKNVSFYIVERLKEYGVKYVFGVIGSAMYRIFQALGETDDIDYVCTLHEQGASMAADSYARVKNDLGVCVVTCGPGTTNVMTGCAGSFTDSVPVLYLAGYPNINGTRKNMPIRHLAYQEFDIVNMFKPVTKYIKLVEKPEEIRYELEKAISIATTGRKGPVMLVLPENVMFNDIEINYLQSYFKENVSNKLSNKTNDDIFSYCFDALLTTKKPVLLFGAGVRGANATGQALELSRLFGCPTALTYPMRDMLDYLDPINPGSVGIFGSRGRLF